MYNQFSSESAGFRRSDHDELADLTDDLNILKNSGSTSSNSKLQKAETLNKK